MSRHFAAGSAAGACSGIGKKPRATRSGAIVGSNTPPDASAISIAVLITSKVLRSTAIAVVLASRLRRDTSLSNSWKLISAWIPAISAKPRSATRFASSSFSPSMRIETIVPRSGRARRNWASGLFVADRREAAGEPAIDDMRPAGDVGRAVAREEQRELRHVLGFGITAEGRHRQLVGIDVELVLHVGEVERRVHAARQDRVDAHAFGGEDLGGGANQAEHPMLGGAVGGVVGKPQNAAGGGGNHDRALLANRAPHSADAEIATAQIDRDDAIEILDLAVIEEAGAGAVKTRIEEGDVKPAIAIDRLLHHAVVVRLARNIDLGCESLTPLVANEGGDFLGQRAVEIGDTDFAALVRETARRGFADAGRAACDDDRFTLEALAHDCFTRPPWRRASCGSTGSDARRSCGSWSSTPHAAQCPSARGTGSRPRPQPPDARHSGSPGRPCRKRLPRHGSCRSKPK